MHLLKTILKTITVLAAIFGVITGILRCMEWYNNPKKALKANIYYGKYIEYPENAKQLSMLMNDLESGTAINYLIKKINDERCKPYLDTMCAKIGLFYGISDILSGYRHRNKFKFNERGGYYWIELQNNGKNLISNIAINIPEADFISIYFNDEEKQEIENKTKCAISSIQPEEKITIYAWTKYEPTEKKAKEVKISHTNGTTKKVLYKQIAGIGKVIDDTLLPTISIFWGIAFMFLMMFSIVFGITYINENILAKKNTKTTKNKSKSKPTDDS